MAEDVTQAVFGAALQPYAGIDVSQRALLDAAAALAVETFDCSVAVIGLAGRDRVQPPAIQGVAGQDEAALRAGLSATAIRATDRTALDPQTLANPAVARTLGLRVQAGLPLRSTRGDHLGTLTLLDRSPRVVDDQRLASMRRLADALVDVLETRLRARAVTSGG